MIESSEHARLVILDGMKNPVHILIVLVILFLVVGCGGQTATATHQPTNTPQASDTSVPTAKLTLTDTPIPTNSPQWTDTPEPTLTFAPIPSQTTAPARTATMTGTPEPTATVEPTSTPEPTVTAENTPTVQPTATQEPTSTPAPTDTPPPTATATEAPTATAETITMENMFPEWGRISGGGLTVSLSEGTLRAGGIGSITLDPSLLDNAYKLLLARLACEAARVSYYPKVEELNPDIIASDPKLSLFNIDSNLWEDYSTLLALYEENEKLGDQGFDYNFGFGRNLSGVVNSIDDHVVTAEEWEIVKDRLVASDVDYHELRLVEEPSMRTYNHRAILFFDNGLKIYRNQGEDFYPDVSYSSEYKTILKTLTQMPIFLEMAIGQQIGRKRGAAPRFMLVNIGCTLEKDLCKYSGSGELDINFVGQ